MLLARAVLVLLLAAQAVQGHTQPQSEQGLEAGAPQLALLFKANLSSACTRRCRLRATAAGCAGDGGGDGATAAGSSEAAQLEEWNSLAVGWQQAVVFEVAVEVDCGTDSACHPAPARFVAWRGGDCGGAGPAAEPALQAQPLPGSLHGNASLVYVLNAEHPVVTVTHKPADCQPAAVTGVPPAGNDTSGDAAGLPEQPAAGAIATPSAAAAAPEPAQCSTRGLLRAKLALAAWLAACVAVGARL